MFARERYSLPLGDMDRVKNQMQVMKSIMAKITSPYALLHYRNMLESITQGVETDISASEMLGLIRMQLKDMSEWEITC
jgi:anionic cell wall polymer biosynthesis LytR-Cps2A-Psr (LCP) family protein